MGKLFIGAGIAVAIALFAITGDPPVLEQSMIELLTSIDLFLDQNVRHPTLLSFIAGVIFVAYILRPIFWIFERKRAYEDLREKLSKLGGTRSDFFKHLATAYQHYKAGKQGLPETHNEFIDGIDYPSWLDGKAKDLSDIANTKVKTEQNEGWIFCRALYREIETVRSGRENRSVFFDKIEECNEFHKERQALVDFWNDVGKKYSSWKLPRKKTIIETKDHWRSIKILAYLSVAVYLQNKQNGPCAKHLYEYARSHFVTDTEYGPWQIP